MRIVLTADIDGHFVSERVSVELPEPIVESFKPLKITDCEFGRILGEVPARSAQAEKVLVLREKAAREIADGLTELLLDLMRKNDKFNGYKIVEETEHDNSNRNNKRVRHAAYGRP